MNLKRKLVMKALTDPEFRRKLKEDPRQVLSEEELKEITGGIDGVVSTTDFIDVISKIIAPCYFCVDYSDPF